MVTVLVVDDDPAICELLEVVLSEEGYDVQCATRIGDALESVATHQPAVILFDMSLGDGDGALFVERYRQLPQAHAHLIAVSGIPALDEEAARIGADAYLPKPFDLDDLLALVAGLLPETQRSA